MTECAGDRYSERLKICLGALHFQVASYVQTGHSYGIPGIFEFFIALSELRSTRASFVKSEGWKFPNPRRTFFNTEHVTLSKTYPLYTWLSTLFADRVPSS